MPVVQSLVTVLSCETCLTTITHVAGTRSPLAEEFVEASRWYWIPAQHPGEKATVFCPKCGPVMETVTTQLEHGLDAFYTDTTAAARDRLRTLRN